MHRRLLPIVLLPWMSALPAVATEYLFVHNTYSGDVSKVSIPGHEVVSTMETGFYTDYLAKSPDNTILYVNRINGDLEGAPVPNIGVDGEILAYDTRTGDLLWRVHLDGMPHHICVSKDGRHLYIPYYDSWWVAVLDLDTREIIKKIWTGHGSHGTRLSHDGERLYVGSMMYDFLTIIDTSTLDVVRRYTFADGVRPFAFPRDESVLYVQLSRLHGFVVLDPETRAQRTVRLPDHGKEVPTPQLYPHTVNHGMALNPSETELWCNASTLGFVAVYSHPELEHIADIPVGRDPNAIVFDSAGRYAYITNRGDHDLSVIDARTHEEIKRIPLGKYPQRMLVIDVPE